MMVRLRRLAKAGVDWFVGNDLVTGTLFVATVTLLIYSQVRPVSYGVLVEGEVAVQDYIVPFDVDLIDLNLMVVASSQTQQSPEIINVGLPPGAYFIRVWSPTMTTNTYGLDVFAQ